MDREIKTQPVYGPAWEGDPPSDGSADCFIPRPYKGIDLQALQEQGLTFSQEDLLDGEGLFRTNGLVSSDRSMVVLFCDLKGSTAALDALGSRFRDLQRAFFNSCTRAVRDTNKELRNARPDSRYPRIVIDKFMGDGAMFYIDCGNTPSHHMEEIRPTAAKHALRVVHRIIDATHNISSLPEMKDLTGNLYARQVEIGVRFGIAMGSGITLSVLGCSPADGECAGQGDFTLTGTVVNLAARLEHATLAEFLSCITENANRLRQYTSCMNDLGQVRGTALGDAMLKADQQIIHLFANCEQNYEIRADSNFRRYLERLDPPIRLSWKEVPFSPRGFAGNLMTHLLGGNRSEEIFREV